MSERLDTIAMAHGRWREILPAFGIGRPFLSGKHGPCPVCGGKDRFRFDDKNGSGSYYCNQCGAGSGIMLIRKLKGWTFKEAADEVDKLIGNLPPPQVQRVAARKNDAWRERDILRLLDDATAPYIVADYLERRGLSIGSKVLQGHPRCMFFEDRDGRQVLVGRYPAVIAPIIGPDGSLQSAHRIYISDAIPKGERKKMMPAIRDVKGAAVRLFEVAEEMGVAEGIETALACAQMWSLPVWAGLNAGGIERFEPSPGVTTLHVYGDNDKNGTGQAAAFNLKKRLSRERPEIAVKVAVPLVEGTDWLDVLVSRGAVA
jgi:putative DNA primase/helicase